MTKIVFQERLEDAERLNISASEEFWNTYGLEDGTKLKVRLVLASVFKLKNKYSRLGEPIYVIKTDNVIDAQAPDGLIKSSQLYKIFDGLCFIEKPIRIKKK
ncbi:MAG: hypothetical protein HXS46_07380 [Theionarchaea archaeon]|nr:hypothetical protein [Theionarchaea archaeon]